VRSEEDLRTHGEKGKNKEKKKNRTYPPPDVREGEVMIRPSS